MSTGEGIGEDYVSNHLESRKNPIYEDGSKSAHNNTPKDVQYDPQNCISLRSYKNAVDFSIYKYENT